MATQPAMGRLFKDDDASQHGPVECLGLTFESDEARRAYFLDRLREKLQDPAFRQIEGFPLGSDEDILALSDPPYYTACPNPFIEDFIKHYGTPYDPEQPYSREPFAVDVSEGKNDPIYNAHSYHTKVPHKAIMRYILHYTEPGDVVFDGFCGTGMTGVAAQLCGERKVVEALGYQVLDDGTILRPEEAENGKASWKPFSKLGARRAVLNDLSPAATFIAYNYNTAVDLVEFEREATRILYEVEAECGWMYETMHTDNKGKGLINYTIWSDVFSCPECASEIVFWSVAVDKGAGTVRDVFPCPQCNASLTKGTMDRAWLTTVDKANNQTRKVAKQVPVLINYSVGSKRFEKVPTNEDLALIKRIDDDDIPWWFPACRMPAGDEARRNDDIGLTHAHHYFTSRNLKVLSNFASKCSNSRLKIILTGALPDLMVTARLRIGAYFHGGRGVVSAGISGTYYVPSVSVEKRALFGLDNRLATIARVLDRIAQPGTVATGTASLSSMSQAPSNSVDYLFLDPPFGANLMYSELNFLWEAWLKVFTNNEPEAVENNAQGKRLDDYRNLMVFCFREAFRVLKPGRWMTVEFSNTKASVWNAIQTALQDAGFVVANVAALDKQQGSFKAVTTTTAVKQDLVISAYKPNGGLEERFKEEAETEEAVWDFVRTHLQHLRPYLNNNGEAGFIVERDPRILFDRMVAYFVRHGCPVPLSASEFQDGLVQRFAERDGMFFLAAQVSEYDRKRLLARGVSQRSLFVNDERSAIDWLQDYLKSRPSTYQEILPPFMKQLVAGWKKGEVKPELSDLLEQSFLRYDGKGDVPSQIHSYLSSNYKDLRNLAKDDPRLQSRAKDRWYVPDPNKKADLEKLRERSLFKEFVDYRASKQRQLKHFRLEVLRVGFRKAWQERDYATIIDVARRIPEDALLEDELLTMLRDNALTRIGAEP